MAFLSRFADLHRFMLDIADRTYGSLAVESYEADLAGGKSYLSHAVLFSHELSGGTRRTDKLSALAGIKLYIVDHGTDRDNRYRLAHHNEAF